MLLSPDLEIAAEVRALSSCLPQVHVAPKFFVASCTRGNKRSEGGVKKQEFVVARRESSRRRA